MFGTKNYNNDEVIIPFDYNSSHFIAFEVVQESLILLLPLIIAPTKLISDLIRATICVLASVMLCIDALRFKYTLMNHFSEENKAVIALSTISYLESLTASGDIIGNVAEKVQSICSAIALFSIIALAVTISAQLIALTHLAFKTFQLRNSGDPTYSKQCEELKKKSMHLMLECFFGFSAFTGVVALNTMTLGIATGIIALLLLLVLGHKRKLEKQEVAKLTTANEITKNENAQIEANQKIFETTICLPTVSTTPSTLFETCEQVNANIDGITNNKLTSIEECPADHFAQSCLDQLSF